jgi:hypothetical protein
VRPQGDSNATAPRRETSPEPRPNASKQAVSPPEDVASAETIPDGSRRTILELEAAIERVTRAMLTASDDVVGELVAERRAMRAELDALRCPTNVASIDAARARRRV